MILDGRSVAKEFEEKIKSRVEEAREKYNRVPKLATILVGDDEASKTYVRMKERACERVGMESVHVELDKDISQEELMGVINKLNEDESVDGILLQHPIPKHLDERECFDLISVEKDVDGVNSASFGAFSNGKKAYKSATPYGMIRLLDYYGIDVTGMNAIVIGRSAILGKPVAMLLLEKNATVTIAHSKTKNLKELVKQSDIVVACIGKDGFIKEDWLKPGCIILDAGYCNNKGDVDSKGYELASAYTPVPGGVGPMTINSLLLQTMESFSEKMEKQFKNKAIHKINNYKGVKG